MVFTSNIFLFLFLPIVLSCYYIIKKQNLRNMFLLFCSLLFYSWQQPKFILVIILSIIINYMGGICIYITKEKKQIVKKGVLILFVIANISLLFYFKYTNFFIQIINSLFNKSIAVKQIILPIGISFFTFQGMSYILDLYMERASVQKNPLNIALYVALFPQLIAGPIVRYKDINEQIDERTYNIEKFYYGIKRFIIGLGKKVIISNQIAIIVDKIFANDVLSNSVSAAWLGAIGYSIQIYFDFSGYSDMAIGLGKMFGFDFLENFNYPYISNCITDFWRRWHISLSSWFRDYIYIPLGGSRKGNVYVNLFIVFLITGFWHGASWNFIWWGIWHGCFILIERFLKRSEITVSCKIFKLIRHVYTLIVVLLGWIFFRSPDMNYAMKYIAIMFGFVQSQNVDYTLYYYLNSKTIFILIMSIILSIPVCGKIKGITIKNIGNEGCEVIDCITLYGIFIICIILIMNMTYNPFIYFRF